MTFSPYVSENLDDEEIRARGQASIDMAESILETKKADANKALAQQQQEQLDPTGGGEPAQEGEQQPDEPERNSRGQVIGEPIGEPIQVPGGGNGIGGVGPTGMMPMPTMTKEQAIPIGETMAAPAVGMVDGFVDMYNWFTPGPDIPKIPKFKTQSAQGLRDISSIIGPIFTGVGALGTAAKGLHAAGKISILGRSLSTPKVVQALGNNPIFKFFAKHGLEGGVGVAVDISNKNSEGDNTQRMARDWLKTPDSEKLFGLLPGDWATNDQDSPDDKRRKNAYEGFGLGIMFGIGEGIFKVAKGISGTDAATRWVPKDHTSKSYFDSIKNDQFSKVKYSDDALEDSLLRAEARQQAALDDLGEYYMVQRNAENLTAGQPFQRLDEMEFDQPIKGVHEDAFDIGENGVRAVDEDGVPGAMVDAVRVQKNIGTQHGRLGSMTTESALRYGLEATDATSRVVVKSIMKEIKDSGKFDYLYNGARIITDKEIDEAGTFLASKMADMDVEEMKVLLDEFKRADDSLKIKQVNSVGYDAVMKTFKSDLEKYVSLFDPDEAKAAAYLTHSLAGQAADMAEEVLKLEGTAALDAIAEPLLTRMQYLMTEKALASYDAGSTLRNMNIWERAKRLGKGPNITEEIENRTRFLRGVVDESRRYAEELKAIAREKPNYLRPLYEAFAATDGDINSMYRLNNYVRNNLSAINKGFIDNQPEIPNHLVQGFWGNFYNSALSATSTTVKALVGNSGGLLARPITSMVGALLDGDLRFMRRAAYQYAGLADAFGQSWKKSGEFMRMASESPIQAAALGRPDLALKHEQNFAVLDMFADAAMKEGNDGPAILMEIVKAQSSAMFNPVMRWSANVMSAYDIGVKAFVATAEARGHAIDNVLSAGGDFSDWSRVSRKKRKKIIDAEFNEMWESDGLQIKKDKATRYMSGEIALNLDGALSNAIGEMVKYYPMTKPWFLFPRTSTNMVGMFKNYSLLNSFSSEFWDFKPFTPIDQIPFDHMEAILKKKGITPDGDYFNTFKQMRYEMKGRIAVGTGAIMYGAFQFQNGRLRGNGHWDENIQRARVGQDWKKKTYMGVDGRWHSYEWLGPIGDWLAATADIFDNFDSLTYTTTEKMLQKLSFVMGASLFDRSVFAMMEPLNDVMSGNGSAASRWAASFANNTVAFGGMRNQFSRLMSDGLKELDDDFVSLVRNRNNFLDLVNPAGANPDAYDWIDGSRVGAVEDPFQRFANVLTGMPTSERMSPERRFLVGMEFDARLAVSKNPDGIKYLPQERSAIYSKIGELGTFREKVREMMAEDKVMEYQKRIRAERQKGVTSIDLALEKTILYSRLNTALQDAVREAVAHLDAPMIMAIEERAQIKRMNDSATKQDRYQDILLPTY